MAVGDRGGRASVIPAARTHHPRRRRRLSSGRRRAAGSLPIRRRGGPASVRSATASGCAGAAIGGAQVRQAPERAVESPREVGRSSHTTRSAGTGRGRPGRTLRCASSCRSPPPGRSRHAARPAPDSGNVWQHPRHLRRPRPRARRRRARLRRVSSMTKRMSSLAIDPRTYAFPSRKPACRSCRRRTAGARAVTAARDQQTDGERPGSHR